MNDENGSQPLDERSPAQNVRRAAARAIAALAPPEPLDQRLDERQHELSREPLDRVADQLGVRVREARLEQAAVRRMQRLDERLRERGRGREVEDGLSRRRDRGRVLVHRVVILAGGDRRFARLDDLETAQTLGEGRTGLVDVERALVDHGRIGSRGRDEAGRDDTAGRLDVARTRGRGADRLVVAVRQRALALRRTQLDARKESAVRIPVRLQRSTQAREGARRTTESKTGLSAPRTVRNDAATNATSTMPSVDPTTTISLAGCSTCTRDLDRLPLAGDGPAGATKIDSGSSTIATDAPSPEPTAARVETSDGVAMVRTSVSSDRLATNTASAAAGSNDQMLTVRSDMAEVAKLIRVDRPTSAASSQTRRSIDVACPVQLPTTVCSRSWTAS